jgi:PAS domain S-box-containing protein
LDEQEILAMDALSASPETSFIIPAFLISAGIVFYLGLQAVVVGVLGRHRPVYFSFAVTCLCAVAYQLATAAYYTAGSVTAAVSALHWQTTSVLIFHAAFFGFVALYTGQRRIKPWLIGVSAGCLLFLILDWSLPYGLRFTGLVADGFWRLPWGEPLARFKGTPSGLNGWVRAAHSAEFIWAAARCVLQYRGGERRPALLLGTYLGIQFAAGIQGGLVDVGLLDSIYTSGFGFLVLAVLMSIGMGIEIRERTLAVEATTGELRSTVDRLKQSEERLQRAIDAGNVGTWEWDILTNRFAWSKGAEKIFGIEPGSFSGTYEAYRALVHPDDLESLNRTVKRAMEQEGPFTVEYRIARPDGESRWLLGRGQSDRGPDGRIVRIHGTVLDITQRKRAEEAIHESEERFRRLSEGPLEGVVLSEKGRILDVNEQFARMFGLTPNEMIGMPVSDFVAPESRELVLGKIDSGDETPYEHMAVRRNGSVFPVEVNGKTIPYKGRSARVTVIRDITERKRAEQGLRNALAEVEKLKNRLQEENIYLQDEIKVAHNFEEFITRSQNVKQVLHKVEQVAPTDATVLILGESGTGKELLARAIHHLSHRSDRALVKVNCSALPEPLIESELFGHEKGAFTGATARKSGRFELADGGTIFLDEIGDLPVELQVKLLRVLQEGEFERLGSSNTLKVDVRVIAATNRNLDDAIRRGTFREDLFYRLNVFPVTLPPLRDRKEDVPDLARHFIKKYCAIIGKKIEKIPPGIFNALMAYDWPGNVRELENVIERAVILTNGPVLEIDESFESKPVLSPHVAGPVTLRDNERALIRRALEETRWIIEGTNGAAVRLGIAPSTLRDRIEKYGLQRPRPDS